MEMALTLDRSAVDYGCFGLGVRYFESLDSVWDGHCANTLQSLKCIEVCVLHHSNTNVIETCRLLEQYCDILALNNQ